MTVLMQRPRVVEGKTYKLKPPVPDCAFYVTVNHVALEDGTVRPIEVFINTKDAQAHQWIAGITRTLSALMRNSDNIDFILDELDQVRDPEGLYHDNGQQWQSIVQQVASVIRDHCKSLGQGRLTP